MTGRLLITGGAGYVGSHCARRLAGAGFEVVTVDDLSHGHRAAVSGELVVADVRDRSAMRRLLERGFDVVLHFAARMSVGESHERPLEYWDVNVAGTAALLTSMREAGVRRFVFSSTCAVHGHPPEGLVAESTPFAPISPYGETKVAAERMLCAAERAGQLDVVRLRYFNAAGAARDGWLGESHDPETHLIPLALAAASEGRPMYLFGDDYPTEDGTCIRDYVHVEDLAEAHLAAVRRLLSGGQSAVYCLGTGRGASVRAVLDTVERVTGHRLARRVAPRRPGDPPRLVANPTAAAEALGWKARYDLEQIVRDAWRWHLEPRY